MERLPNCTACIQTHTYLYTYVHTCIHTYIHACIHIYTHTLYVHACIYTYIYTCTHTYLHSHMYIHIYMHACTYTIKFIHTCNHTTYMHAYMYVIEKRRLEKVRKGVGVILSPRPRKSSSIWYFREDMKSVNPWTSMSWSCVLWAIIKNWRRARWLLCLEHVPKRKRA